VIDALLTTLEAHTGLKRRHDWQDLASTVLEQAARERGTEPEALIARAPIDAELLSRLASALTVNETYFYRHARHFAVVAGAVERCCAAGRRACIWSAGCASGEEPYSVAIAILTAHGPAGLAGTRILGTDLSPSAIARARAATYGRWSFRETSDAWRDRFFDVEGSAFRPVASVRASVELEVAETRAHAAGLADASIDVVLFRNVAIYLSDDALEETYRELRRVLRPDGILIVAPADPRPGALFTATADESTSVYRPADAVATAPAISQAPTRRPPPPAARARRAPASATRRLPFATPVSVTRPAASLVAAGVSHLAADEIEEALKDLRHALYLAPSHRLARFWYAEALRCAGQARAARSQAQELERVLASSPSDALVEDGVTPAQELLAAARVMAEDLS
jgi:chemotaxis protein methyltransferase CheR